MRCRWLVILLIAVLCGPLGAQVTGRISGNVADPSGDAIIGAQVTATNQGTGETRVVQTNDLGVFVLTGMPPSAYSIRVEFEGFRPLEKTNLVLNANQILSVGEFRLEIGAVTEKVTVVAEGVQVQTETSGNTALLSGNQLQGMPSRGRDITSLMVLMPGAAQNTDSDALGGNWGSATPNMNGLRSYYNTFKLDGQPGSDIDVLNFFTISVSMDAIQEVSVKTNSYTAEEGRLPGVHVNIVSKSGTNEFHGSGYWFKRHESFNANSFFNNQQGVSRPANRFDTFGGTLGGPVYIPGKFNSNKDKLFFYASYERWRIRLPGNLFQATLPTELERRGDFSQSFDQNGKLITVFDPNTLDPLTGQKQPFSGNVIPSNRINPSGQGLLNFHPMPNFFDTNITRGAFNYRALDEVGQPKQQIQLKFDWVPTSKDRISFRPRWWRSDRQSQVSSTAFAANFFKQRHHYNYPTVAHQGSYTRTFSANVLNEFNMGWDKRQELGDLNDEFQLADVRRADYAPNLPQLFPAVNPLGLMPRMTFGGLPNAPSSDFDPRTPIAAKDIRWFISNNVSWIKNNHTMKFGIYWELNDASEGPRAAALGRHMGTFDFGRDNNNPFESNHPFANAILGNFTSYAEANNMTNGLARTYTLEWFAQDSWKVNRRLTVDLGIRFYSFTPWRLVEDEGSAFVLDRFKVSDIPAFFEPARDAQGRRVARNPITGALAPVPLIGAFVPGNGDRLNGRVPSGESSVPDGFRDRPPLQVAPRIGFAYDVFGNGKTAVRGGFGITKQAIFSSQQSMWATTTSPPLVESPQIFYDNIENLRNTDAEIFFPADAQAFEQDYNKVPTIYNWSFGIQQELARGTVLDVSYVGSTGRHLQQQQNLNVLPPGARFLDSSIDQTTGRPLPDNFLRPYRGLGGLNYLQDVGWSNYNGLQLALNRRYTAGVQFGLSYTYSKAMGIGNTSGDGSGLPLYTNYRTYLYGKVPFDQTHVLTFNYVWSLPNAAALGGNAVSRAVFHDWELAGILTFASGFPSGVGFSYTDGVDRWGGGDGPRTVILDNPNFGYGDREFSQWFNTKAIGAPGNSFGNAPIDVFRGPGINNWDSSIFKYFRFTEEVNLRIGFEFYNFLNHTQWSSVDTSARFDPQGNQVNGRFGQVIGTRNPRQMQFTARLTF